jgi:hypothetical protein
MDSHHSTNHPVTIVTAFVSNANQREAHHNGEYLRNGKLLLQSTTPKIVFLDEYMFAQISDNDYNSENTKIVLFGKEEMYYMKYLEKLINYTPSHNKEKDTKEFLLLMWNKTEYMRAATLLNLFATDHYVWVDFGIRYVCRNTSDEAYVESLNALSHPTTSNHTTATDCRIRLGGIWDVSRHYFQLNPILDVHWYFAGGVFGGNKSSLLWFSEEMRQMCEEIVQTHGTATWEVNVWYLIYRKWPGMFDIYPCNHDETLLAGYSSVPPITHFVHLSLSYENI